MNLGGLEVTTTSDEPHASQIMTSPYRRRPDRIPPRRGQSLNDRPCGAGRPLLTARLLVSGQIGEPKAGDPTAQDALPADLPDHAYRDVYVDSSRYVGDDDGTQLWLVRGTERDSVCLVTVTDIDADDWQIGCSGAAGPLTMGSYVVHSDGYPTPDDAVPISENVYRN